MIESVVGMTSAAPTPITARRPIRVDGVSTKMAASDAAPNDHGQDGAPVKRREGGGG